MREPDAEVREVGGDHGVAGRLEELLARAEEEAAYAEIRHTLAEGIRQRRLAHRLSQDALADLVGSSQPRVSMMESGHDSVSVKLLITTLLRLGARRREIGGLLIG